VSGGERVVFATSDASDDNDDDRGFGKLTQDLPYMVILVKKKECANARHDKDF
jgi:hypothetical protein